MCPIINSPTITNVYGYWTKISPNEAVPPIRSVEPNQISNPACHLYFATVTKDDEGTRFKFRTLDHASHKNQGQHNVPRIQLLSQISEHSMALQLSLDCAVKMKLPVVDVVKFKTGNGFTFTIEHLALPLSDDGETVTEILGAIDFIESKETNLDRLLLNLNWRSIGSVEIEKRILIASLRTEGR